MLSRQSGPFVRAKPQKISLTETYCYRAQVQKFLNFQFEKAEGELKLEFVYDGERPKTGWKLRQFLTDLVRRSKILKKLKDLSLSFLKLILLGLTLKKSRQKKLLQWLKNKVLGQYLSPPASHFGIAAIADVEKHQKYCKMARVGHLALRGYRSPNFSEDWPEQQPLRINIPIDNLREKLDHRARHILTYKYQPQEPKALPVHLRNIKLTDMDWDESTELHSDYDEILNMKIPLMVDIAQPDVDEEGKVPEDVIRQWWQKYNKKSETDSKNASETGDRQIITLDEEGLQSPDELAKTLQSLAIDRGGYLLIHVKGLKVSDKKKFAKKHLELKKLLLQAAFQPGPLFVPIFSPYHCRFDDKLLFIVAVPAVPTEWYRKLPASSRHRYFSNLWVHSPEAEPIHTTIEYVKEEKEKEDKEKRQAVMVKLAKTLSAMANTEGGYIFFKAKDMERRDFFENFLFRATWYCVPSLDLQLLTWKHIGRQGWQIKVKHTSPKVHRLGDIIYHWKNEQAELLFSLTESESIDELYEFICERCKLDYPTIEARPVITYAYLKGPRFDGRDQKGARYDPQRDILKWIKEIPFLRNIENQTYETDLDLWLNRPVELYRRGHLTGEIHILLEDKLLSGLDIAYFNTVGQQLTDISSGVEIEKKSKVKIVFDHILLRSVFERRWFIATRELEFEGVKPTLDRLEDIKGILADLGLEDIKVWVKEEVDEFNSPVDEIPVTDVLKYHSGYLIYGERPDGLRLKLYLTGEITNLNRKRKEGKRTDQMRINSGHMRLVLKGWVEGELSQAQELSHLLNRLQRLLKDRFSHVRTQIA